MTIKISHGPTVLSGPLHWWPVNMSTNMFLFFYELKIKSRRAVKYDPVAYWLPNIKHLSSTYKLFRIYRKSAVIGSVHYNAVGLTSILVSLLFRERKSQVLHAEFMRQHTKLMINLLKRSWIDWYYFFKLFFQNIKNIFDFWPNVTPLHFGYKYISCITDWFG